MAPKSAKKVAQGETGNSGVRRNFFALCRKELENGLWMMAAKGGVEPVIERALMFFDALYIDSLTKAYNRRAFDLFIEDLAKLFRREKDLFASIAILDFDGFKKINDCHGHAMGDIVLKEVAAIFRKQFPEEAIVARLGGDEFAVGVLNMPKGEVEERLEGARQKIEKLSWKSPSEEMLTLDVSFTFSAEEARGASEVAKIKELLHDTDRRVSEQKDRRKNPR